MRVFAKRIPSLLGCGDTSLRRLSPWHCPALFRGLSEENLLPGRFSGVLPFARFMRKTFPVCYVIFASGRPVGFIGLHDVKAWESAWLSLCVFDKNFRGRGVGRAAFGLLAAEIGRNRIARKLSARTDTENRRALSLLRAAGFMKTSEAGRAATFEMRLF